MMVDESQKLWGQRTLESSSYELNVSRLFSYLSKSLKKSLDECRVGEMEYDDEIKMRIKNVIEKHLHAAEESGFIESKKGVFAASKSVCDALDIPVIVNEQVPDDEIWMVRPMSVDCDEESSNSDKGEIVFNVEYEVLGKFSIRVE